MAEIKAVNRYVFIQRDEAKEIKDGLLYPNSGQVRPNSGLIISVGKMVQDPEIKKGKIALFHQHTGQVMEYDGIEYTILPDEHIIGIV